MPTDVAETCAEIRAFHRRRMYAMKQRQRADHALLALLREQLGWHRDAPAFHREAIEHHAKILVAYAELKLAERATDHTPDDYAEWSDVIEATVLARAPFNRMEAEATKVMERLASELPVWEAWATDMRGFGARSLATIVGEAGDLSAYPQKGHLWKRMGLAVIGAGDGLDDHRQGSPGPAATKDDWIAEGYKAARRSCMFVIGDVLVKTQGPYREVYLARKDYERSRAEQLGLIIAPAAKIPDKRKAEFRSEGHIHLRAQRYMEKRLLRDLWQAWRRAASDAAPHHVITHLERAAA